MSVIVAGTLTACEAGAADSDGADATGGNDATSGLDATRAPDGRDTTRGGETGAADEPPTLTSVSAHIAGVKGVDLDLALVGGDVDGDAELARVRVFDGSGAPVLAFRSGLGDPDSNEQLVAFAAPVAGQKTFIASVRLRELIGDHPDIAKVEVALRDATGELSADVSADIAAQPVRQLGDACDPAAIEDRCTSGFGCRGTPAQCQEGLAPEVAKVAYLKGEGGTRILVQGVDAEEDVATVLIEFLDAAGQTLLVDLDNDEVPESSEFEVSTIDVLADGAFLVKVTPVAGFDLLVPQIAVTATDAAGHVGVRKTAKLAAAPVRAVGQACDANGFDVCNPATAVCVAAANGTSHTCKPKAQLGAAECAAAQILEPDGVAVFGVADGPSLWDAPATCSSGDPTGRPEAVAVLRLSAPAARLTLTTALDGTNFDTVLYLLPGCGAANAVPLGCGDDASDGGAAATLELELVPAGDYLVVVDAWGAEGGSFALSASLE